MKPALKSILLTALMLLSAGLALYIRPTLRIADQKPPVNLATTIPESFGDWREVKQSTQQIVNPQEQQMLNEIYSQTLSRTYINSAGYRVMLSIAYGGDQSRDLQVHRPEVCYSAQGFKLSNQEKMSLQIGDREIPAMRLQTQLGSRVEPLTYWVRIGDKIVRGNLEQGFARLAYGIKGRIADGLLFRISSIDSEPSNAYTNQAIFGKALFAVLPAANQEVFIGTASAGQN